MIRPSRHCTVHLIGEQTQLKCECEAVRRPLHRLIWPARRHFLKATSDEKLGK